MKYSYEYKRQCVTLYRQGSWPLTPKGVQPQHFRDMIRRWVRTEEAQGPEALRHKAQNKVWTAAEKLALVAKISAGYFICSVACQAEINSGMLYTWVRKYKTLGYTGLIPKQKGRPAKHTAMKKRIALREQKQAAQDVVALRNTEVVKTIQDIFTQHQERYGVRRIYRTLRTLRSLGYTINHKRVQRLMHQTGLAGKRLKAKYRSYQGHVGAIADNVIQQNFKIHYYNTERIQQKIKWMPPVTYRLASI